MTVLIIIAMIVLIILEALHVQRCRRRVDDLLPPLRSVQTGPTAGPTPRPALVRIEPARRGPQGLTVRRGYEDDLPPAA
ncbi:MAG: hypothetical protein AAGD35_08670 [Actinomycetota bacterium]